MCVCSWWARRWQKPVGRRKTNNNSLAVPSSPTRAEVVTTHGNPGSRKDLMLRVCCRTPHPKGVGLPPAPSPMRSSGNKAAFAHPTRRPLRPNSNFPSGPLLEEPTAPLTLLCRALTHSLCLQTTDDWNVGSCSYGAVRRVSTSAS